jgi:putative DNA primase/helicase
LSACERTISLERALALRASHVDAGQPLKRHDGQPAITLISGASVAPEAIRWLWPGYLARAKLHLVAGKPSAGKTTVVLDLCATITRAGTLPDGTRAEAGNVVIWSGEDGIADTLSPRLHAAGADMSRVFFVGYREEGAERRAFDPARDMPLLHRTVDEAGGVSVLVLDPIVSAIQGDSHKNAEVRRGLQPIVDFAAATDAAVIGITHLSKGTGGQDPVDRITGSLAFGAVTRLAFLVAREDGGDEGPSRRVITRAKSNIGPDGGGFYYDIASMALPGHPGVTTSKVQWLGVAEGTARDIIGTAEASQDEEGRSSLDEACEFLLDVLTEKPLSAKEVISRAAEAGIAKRTIERAKKQAGVTVLKTGMGGGWLWCLEGHTPKTANFAEDRHSPGVGDLR